MMQQIFQKLLDEAKLSPMLLSDLAGLETYISESYNNRSFIELLQNADDAEADSFWVGRVGDYLVIANNGRPFNSNDIESLCRSASSAKVRGNSIGYRGIGFKSVVSIAKEVHLISGNYEITFSKELTKSLISNLERVPLIRIPHPIRPEVKNQVLYQLKQLQDIGYTTFFIFSGVNINQIDEEYSSFQYTSLLFLNNIKNIDICILKQKTYAVSVENNKEYKYVSVKTKDVMSEWNIYTLGRCSIAFAIENDKIVKLNKRESCIHAFLPTEDICGLGVIVNGDFSTDPSRRHLIGDEISKSVIYDIATLYVDLLNKNLFNSNQYSVDLINALIPFFDVKLVHLTKNVFEREFVDAIKKIVGSSYSFKISPHWLNLHDYCSISNIISNECPTEKSLSLLGVIPLLKFLGAKEDDVNGVLTKLREQEISLEGYAQVASYCIRRILLNEFISDFVNVPLFFVETTKVSLKDLDGLNKKIDESFIQLLRDKGISDNDLRLCFNKLSLINLFNLYSVVERKLGVESNTKGNINIENNDKESTKISQIKEQWFNSNITKDTDKKSVNKWRSAEENALVVLNANGFKLEDVASKNVGYDLEGIDPNGDDIYIEVKSLEWKGQKFRLTNNEYAVAQYKKGKYFLALVIQSQDYIEIGLIKNPIETLNLNRQCVQWVWECSEYSFNSIRFEL